MVIYSIRCICFSDCLHGDIFYMLYLFFRLSTNVYMVIHVIYSICCTCFSHCLHGDTCDILYAVPVFQTVQRCAPCGVRGGGVRPTPRLLKHGHRGLEDHRQQNIRKNASPHEGFNYCCVLWGAQRLRELHQQTIRSKGPG